MINTRIAFVEGRLFFSSQTNNLKNIQTALIGCKKANPLKSHFSFDHVNRQNIRKAERILPLNTVIVVIIIVLWRFITILVLTTWPSQHGCRC